MTTTNIERGEQCGYEMWDSGPSRDESNEGESFEKPDKCPIREDLRGLEHKVTVWFERLERGEG